MMKVTIQELAQKGKSLQRRIVKLADDSADGVWRTVRGRRIFIGKGESFDDALKKSLGGGKSLEKSSSDVHTSASAGLRSVGFKKINPNTYQGNLKDDGRSEIITVNGNRWEHQLDFDNGRRQYTSTLQKGVGGTSLNTYLKARKPLPSLAEVRRGMAADRRAEYPKSRG